MSADVFPAIISHSPPGLQSVVSILYFTPSLRSAVCIIPLACILPLVCSLQFTPGPQSAIHSQQAALH